MKKHLLFLSLISALFLFNACEKEKSFEGSSTPSEGSLQNDITGDCLPKTVAGAYEKNKAVDGATNYIEVQVNVTKPGSYIIYTDTLNGIYFRANGSFTSTGLTTVKLKAFGTPLMDGINTFAVTYNSTECFVPVIILPVGGAVPAVMTLSSGAGGECIDAVLGDGDYVIGVSPTAANTVTLKVNVATAGTYNISTPVSNGIVFSGVGTVSAGANQEITLTASGKPVIEGITNIPVTIGSTSCSFQIDVLDEAPPTSSGFEWTLTLNGVKHTGFTVTAQTDNSTPPLIVMQIGDVNEKFGINLTNTAGVITTGTYSGTDFSGKSIVLVFIDEADNDKSYIGAPTTGSNLVATVTTYNTTTKIIEGTFSGTVIDENGVTATITAGAFKTKLP